VQVDRQLPGDRVVGLVFDRHDRHDPGVVDEDVDRPKVVFDVVEHRRDGGVVGDVDRYAAGAVTDAVRGLDREVAVEVGQNDAAAVTRQRGRGSRADSSAGSGDDHGQTGQLAFGAACHQLSLGTCAGSTGLSERTFAVVTRSTNSVIRPAIRGAMSSCGQWPEPGNGTNSVWGLAASR
jgi:hypothetical protein